MKIFLGTLIAVVLASAQELADEEEYRERMRDIDHSFAALESHRRVKRPEDVEKEAGKLAVLFENVETFWKGRGDEEAASFARMAREGAEEARDAARKENEAALEASIETVARSCEGCHAEPLDKHRIPRKGR